MSDLQQTRAKIEATQQSRSAFEATVAQRAAAPPKSSLEPLPVEPLFPEDAWTEEDQIGLQAALLDKEFWLEDVTRSIRTGAGNLVANTAGLMGDLRSMLPGPRGLASLPTSEEIAPSVGGDPDHPTWWPAAFLAPGPGEFAGASKASLIGLGGFLRSFSDSPKMMSSYQDFLKLEKKLGGKPMDMRTATETGWVRGHDGAPKFFISDVGMEIKNLPLKEGKNVFRFGDMVDHPDLFKAYPDVAEVKLTVYGEAGPDGAMRIRHKPGKGEPKAELVRKGSSTHDDINVYGATGLRSFKGSLLHEVAHIIQEVEGWSAGSKVYTKEFLNKFSEDVMISRMLKKLDQDELADPQVVTNFIKQIGGPNVTDAVQSSVRQYARTVSRLDEFSFTDEVATVTNSVNDTMGRLGHVFEFVLQKKDPSDVEKIVALLDDIDNPEMLATLSSTAYDLKLGELEARLATATQSWDDAMWRAPNKEDPLETLMRAESGDIAPEGYKLTDDIVVGNLGDTKEKLATATRKVD